MPPLEMPRCSICRAPAGVTEARLCGGCGAALRVFASRLRDGKGYYCSAACRTLGTAKPEYIAARFWSKVDRSGGPDACWPWLASRHKRGGYGQFRMPPALGGRTILASHLAYQLLVGPVPAGLWVLHRCDNPPCCNPAHFFLGTNSDNQLDAVAKGRHATSRPGYHSTSRLTADLVAELRAVHASGGWTHTRLGERYGLHAKTVRNVVRRLVWNEV